MANTKQLVIIKKDVQLFNKLRKDDKDFKDIDLSGANLSGAVLNNVNLSYANLSNINLFKANLKKANLIEANLNNANLSLANLDEANLRKANLVYASIENTSLVEANLNQANLSQALLYGVNLKYAKLSRANMVEAFLQEANLSYARLKSTKLNSAILDNANLSHANLTRASLYDANLNGSIFIGAILFKACLMNSNMVEVDLSGADLAESNVYGISAWDIKTDEKTKQNNLLISKSGEPTVTVDNIEVAQFIYLLMNNQKIRDVINTITSKVVLILGRFADKRKPVLDAIREELRKYNYTPILFDFDKPDGRNFVETASVLAHMARFIIADFTDPKIILQEAQHIVPNIVVPFAPILLEGSGPEPVTLYDLRKGKTYVLDTFCYHDIDHLLANLDEEIIKPAEELAGKLNRPNPIK